MIAYFKRFSLQMTIEQALGASHRGRCDEAIAALCRDRKIARQLRKLDPEVVRAELKEYGAWDAEDLADNETNLQRIIWLAAGNIKDSINLRRYHE